MHTPDAPDSTQPDQAAPDRPTIPPGAPPAPPGPIPTATDSLDALDEIAGSDALGDPDALDDPDALEDVGPRYIWLQVLAQFGVFVAFVTPLGISLAIKVEQLAPGQDELLGFITGAGAFATMLFGPILGQLSDRTRTRIGRRRPFMIMGMLGGLVALTIMAQAPSILVLGAGWVLTQLTWGQVLGNLQFSQADRLPEHQRGRVAGLTGFATQVAPVLGVGIASVVSASNLMLFLIPGAIGLVLSSLFIIFVHEPDSRGLVFKERMSLLGVFRRVIFDPRKHPDFAWNWLGRFLFYMGLTLNTTFTSFFFASRLGVTVAEVAPMLAILSLLGIFAISAGAIGGGFLSDRLHRRRAFVLASGVLFGTGAVIMALSPSLLVLMVGSLITSVGLGLFSAVDQALALDVLPTRKEAGRFMAIMGYATSIPQSIAPLIAPFILTVGISAGGDRNYTLLYIVAAVFTVAAGIVVLRIRGVR